MPKDAGLNDGVLCDAAGCIGRLTDGRLASVALSVEAFAEDCTRAAVVISARESPGPCAGMLVDRKIWRDKGALSLRWIGDRFELSAARPPDDQRPWTRGARSVNDIAPARALTTDTTPKTENLEAGD